MDPQQNREEKKFPVALVILLALGVVVVGIVGLAVVAALLVPALMSGRTRAEEVYCQNNLKTLYTAALDHSLSDPFFPHSPEGSDATFNLLLEGRAGEGLKPKTFICRASKQRPAQVVGPSFRVDRATCSYVIVPKRLKKTALNEILMYEKEPHHRGSRNVLFTSGQVRAMNEAEFQERLKRELGR